MLPGGSGVLLLCEDKVQLGLGISDMVRGGIGKGEIGRGKGGIWGGKDGRVKGEGKWGDEKSGKGCVW
jgi:hypothetical protein